jgi:hypothetical protein
LRVAGADDDDGQHRRRRHEQAQAGVRFQREKRRLRAVARGRQAVRAEADPRQQRDERHIVKQGLVGKIPRPADHHVFHPTKHIHKFKANRVNLMTADSAVQRLALPNARGG